MSNRYSLSANPLALILALAVALSGCSDRILTGTGESVSQTDLTCTTDGSELSAKFLSRGTTQDMCAALTKTTDFVLGVSPETSDMQRTLERYQSTEGVTVKRRFEKVFRGFAVHVHREKVAGFIEQITRDADIVSIEPDPRFSLISNAKAREFPAAQQLVSSVRDVEGHRSSARPGDGEGSVDVDVYLLDTGIDHSDLNVVEHIDFTGEQGGIEMTRVLERFDADPAAAPDNVGHGTHVAGIIGAIDNDYGLVGIAPGARLHNFKVLDDEGQGDMSSVIAAMDLIRARKELQPERPIVVNLSLGSDVGTTEYNAMDKAIAVAIDAGVVVVIAAGNEGVDASTVTPAHVTEAITVAATTKDQTLTFSNYGPVVDILAPGDNVRSLYPGLRITVEMSGTSMAAPLVAGLAGLYLSNHPASSPAEVCEALLKNAGRVESDALPVGTTDLFLNASNF